MLVELADAVAEVSLPEFMLTPDNVCGLTVEAGPKKNMNRASLEGLLSNLFLRSSFAPHSAGV